MKYDKIKRNPILRRANFSKSKTRKYLLFISLLSMLLFVTEINAQVTIEAKGQNSQMEILLNVSPCIFIAKNAKIYGKEHLYAKQNTSQKIAQKITKTDSKTQRKTIEPVKNEVTEKKSTKEIVVPDFPFESSSLYYSYISKVLAVPVSQQKRHDYQTICKEKHGNIHSDFENSSLALYLPRQRHKFSTDATQYGLLTSFIPNSPPFA